LDFSWCAIFPELFESGPTGESTKLHNRGNHPL
jgi:hypothetical protein